MINASDARQETQDNALEVVTEKIQSAIQKGSMSTMFVVKEMDESTIKDVVAEMERHGYEVHSMDLREGTSLKVSWANATLPE